MVRNLIKVTVFPCMLGIFFFATKKEKAYDFSHYATTQSSLFDYTVPFEEDVLEIPFHFNPIPFVLNDYIGFKEAIAFKESQGDYFTVNRFGYMGKYQFGQSTLDLLGIDGSYNFLKNPLLQEQAFFLNASRNKWVLRRDIARYNNRWIGGVKVTESGILAAAHLAGPGSVKKFLRSGGTIGFNDAFGTSVRSYLKRFSGYDVSNVAPIKRPHLNELK